MQLSEYIHSWKSLHYAYIFSLVLTVWEIRESFLIYKELRIISILTLQNFRQQCGIKVLVFSYRSI